MLKNDDLWVIVLEPSFRNHKAHLENIVRRFGAYSRVFFRSHTRLTIARTFCAGAFSPRYSLWRLLAGAADGTQALGLCHCGMA